jgi:DNA topoisomerase-1
VSEDLGRRGLPREKVLATVVRLLELTAIRVGNEEYRRANGSHGLTTLRSEHAEAGASSVSFTFRGKSGKEHRIDVRDRALAGIVRRCLDLPGYELFQYMDEAGDVRAVDASDVNAYIREVAGADFSAKDFRTWAGTLLVAVALREAGAAETSAEAARTINAAIDAAAQRLGNTRAVCRSAYVHPEVLCAFVEGIVMGRAARETEGELTGDEGVLLAFLEERAGCA